MIIHVQFQFIDFVVNDAYYFTQINLCENEGGYNEHYICKSVYDNEVVGRCVADGLRRARLAAYKQISDRQDRHSSANGSSRSAPSRKKPSARWGRALAASASNIRKGAKK